MATNASSTDTTSWNPTIDCISVTVGEMVAAVANDVPTLVWVANLASIELHTFLSKRPDVSRPTSFVFDLDPGPPATMLDCEGLPRSATLRPWR
mgnify:CR=1 FL=1